MSLKLLLFIMRSLCKLLIGHHVEEIRVRALKNILFKLEHKLVCPADLVQERQLLINLLEWFNFPKPSLKKEVLGILEILSRVSLQHLVAEAFTGSFNSLIKCNASIQALYLQFFLLSAI